MTYEETESLKLYFVYPNNLPWLKKSQVTFILIKRMYWEKIISHAFELKDYHLSTVRQNQGCHDIVDSLQDNGTNARNSYSLKGKVAPNIILYIKKKSCCTESYYSWNMSCSYGQIKEPKMFSSSPGLSE